MSDDAPILIADIGGTNARFALATKGKVSYQQELVFACQNFPTAAAAIQAYLSGIGVPQVSAMSLAVAGPVVNGVVKATNSHWALSAQQLCEQFQLSDVRLINDFEAAAHCLPHLAKQDLRLIGGQALPDLTVNDFNVAVLGPGTGLGVAGLLKKDGVTTPLVTEGGHLGFAPESELQRQVLQRLASRYERVSDERLLSGPGIENIYWALSASPSTSIMPSAADIFAAAIEESDAVAEQAVSLFFEVLGQVAGNAVLAQGAFDGVYLTGGLARRYADLLPGSHLRQGFDNKGRYKGLMQNIPVVVIHHAYPGLLGAAAANIHKLSI